jgi:hypothetical protein
MRKRIYMDVFFHTVSGRSHHRQERFTYDHDYTLDAQNDETKNSDNNSVDTETRNGREEQRVRHDVEKGNKYRDEVSAQTAERTEDHETGKVDDLEHEENNKLDPVRIRGCEFNISSP